MDNSVEGFDKPSFGMPYTTFEEYFDDLKSQADAMIGLYKQTSKVVGDDEKRKLSMRAQTMFNSSIDYINSRIIDSDNFFAFEYIKKIYKLNNFESFCLLLSLLFDLYDDYKLKLMEIMGHKMKDLNYEIVLKIFLCADSLLSTEDSHSLMYDAKKKLKALCFDGENMIVSERLKDFILSNGENPISVKGISCYVPAQEDELVVNETLAKRIVNFVANNNVNETMYLHLHGCKGIGKTTVVKRVAQIMDTAVVMMDVSWLDKSNEKEFRDLVMTACREQIITQGVICFYNFDSILSENDEDENNQKNQYAYMRYINFILDTARQFSDLVFILSSVKKNDPLIAGERLFIDIPMSMPTKKESIALWNLFFKDFSVSDKIKLTEMANKFSFTPGQIYGTVKEVARWVLWNEGAEIGLSDFCKCAYTQVIHNLENQATLIETKHTLDQLVLAEQEKEMLINACNQIRYKHVVYDEWGFDKRLMYGKGVSMLFAGPPGTGKTMAAQVVASELGIDIYKVNLSKIVSKYIGETEKNLDTLFNEAKKSNVILFFDETDALLGKRTEVKDSHDKNSNLETSYLLQKMEEYDGITVLSTNYVENIDSAFFRRITYVIHFSFPDVNSRREIWKSIFPSDVPLADDIDFDYLASQFEIAGGNIKNIAVVAAFLAAQSKEKVCMRHIIKAIKYELTKQGKTLINDDFGENGYLF